MKSVSLSTKKAAAASSPLEHLIQRLSGILPPPIITSILLAIGLTAVTGWGALYLSRYLYDNAPFHNDSVIYRMRAADTYDAVTSKGVFATFLQSLSEKDSLDLSLRVLLAPGTLKTTHGHLVVLLPFLALFLFQVIWFVFTRTRSFVMAFAAASFILALEIVWNPYWRGIADYGPDVVATWLLGNAEISWLLSRNLGTRKWSFLSGLFLGFLVMQRSSTAVIAGAIFFPLFLWAVFHRLSSDGWKSTLAKSGVFLAPAVLLGFLTVALRWQELYAYYFQSVGGAFHGADQIGAVLDAYLAELPSARNFSLLLVVVVAGFCLLGISSFRTQGWDVLAALWMLAALPLFFVVVLRAAVAEILFIDCYPAFLILLATAVPRSLPSGMTRAFALVLLVLSLVSSVVQYHFSCEHVQETVQAEGPTLAFYRELEDLVMAQPEPRPFGLVVPEKNETLWNHFYYDRGVNLRPAIWMFSVESWYRAGYGDLSAPEVIKVILGTLEEKEGTLAIVSCDRDALSGVFTSAIDTLMGEIKTQPYPLEVALGVYDHLTESPHWQVVQRMKSPYGDMYALQYTKAELTGAAKWAALDRVLTEIPVVAAPNPTFWVYDYASKLSPKLIGGSYRQSLPEGKGGMRLLVFSNTSQPVDFHARVLPEAPGDQPAETLIVIAKGQKQEIRVRPEQEVVVPLRLEGGMNRIEIYLEGVKTTPPDEWSPRFALESPRLTPGTTHQPKGADH